MGGPGRHRHCVIRSVGDVWLQGMVTSSGAGVCHKRLPMFSDYTVTHVSRPYRNGCEPVAPAAALKRTAELRRCAA